MVAHATLFEKSAQERFAEFHAANPHVLDELERITAELVAKGHTRFGIKMVWEVVRWRRLLTTDGDDFKLNNNFHSRYVRLIVERHPEWRDVFELRELKS